MSQGTISDGYGNENYANDLACRWIIAAPVGGIVIRFDSFNTESCCDKVVVSRCTSADCSPMHNVPIVTLSGIPDQAALNTEHISDSGFLQVAFDTNAASGRPGFTAYWRLSRGAVSDATCLSCPAGTYSEDSPGAVSEAVCQDCKAGEYSTTEAAVSRSTCQECMAGSYAPGAGASACANCTAGEYSITHGATDKSNCLKCGSAKFQRSPGSSACVSCMHGSQQSLDSSDCTAHPTCDGWPRDIVDAAVAAVQNRLSKTVDSNTLDALDTFVAHYNRHILKSESCDALFDEVLGTRKTLEIQGITGSASASTRAPYYIFAVVAAVIMSNM